MDWICARLREPSTYAGIVAIVTVAGIRISPEMQEAITAAGIALGGLILVVMKEKKA